MDTPTNPHLHYCKVCKEVVGHCVGECQFNRHPETGEQLEEGESDYCTVHHTNPAYQAPKPEQPE